MTTDFSLGRVSPPKLGHGNRLQLVLVSILREFGCGTFTGSCRWQLFEEFVEDGVEVLLFATGIEHPELFEDPLLEGGGALLAFFSEFLAAVQPRIELFLLVVDIVFPGVLDTLQTGFLGLAILD